MLFKISVKNITKSIKDYAIYFFTLILGVAVFYVFNAIDSQTVMLDVTSSVYEIIKLMTNILSGVSVFVSFILGFLIIYASRFLIKRRNKEFGIYMVLGMSKRRISAILFIETLLIGIVSLATGLVIGTFASQLMSIFVANLFEADMTKFRFIFSYSAAVKTMVYFSLMYLLVMIFNTMSISRYKIIDLMNYGRKNETVKMKNPLVCSIVFAVAVVILGYAYWLVTDGFFEQNVIDNIYVPIVMGCVSTFLIFWSLSGLLINIFTSMKGVYYRGVNSFVLRQFCSKINTTVFSTTVICLMLFITICVLSGALSMKDSLLANIKSSTPVDIEFTKTQYDTLVDAFDSSENKEDYKDILEDSKYGIIETLEKNGFDVKNKLTDITEFGFYYTGLSMSDLMGDSLEEIKQKYTTVYFDSSETIMKLGDYNKIAQLYGNDIYTLEEDEYMVIADYNASIVMHNMALSKGQTIEINGEIYKPKYKGCQYGFVNISSQHINDGIVIVPDSAVLDNQLYKRGLCANYNASSREERQLIEDEINGILSKAYNKTTFLAYNTRIDIMNSSIGLGALVTFVALYLGVIFMISSAAILALKELSESSDNRERYMMLRRIGTDEKMLDAALFKQIGIFFAFPLLLAVIHSVFGIKFINIILSTMGMASMLESVGMTCIIMILIYGGYFIITYICSRNIIRQED